MPDEPIVVARMVAGFWGDSGDADEHGGAVAVVAYECALVFLSHSPPALGRRSEGENGRWILSSDSFASIVRGEWPALVGMRQKVAVDLCFSLRQAEEFGARLK